MSVYSQEILDKFNIIQEASDQELRLYTPCVQPAHLLGLVYSPSEQVYIALESTCNDRIKNPQLLTLKKIDGRGVIKTSLCNFSTKWQNDVLSTQKNDRGKYWKLYDIDVLVSHIKIKQEGDRQEKLWREKRNLERMISDLNHEKDAELIQKIILILEGDRSE